MRSIICILIVLVLSTLIVGQDDPTSIDKGARAILFSFNGLDNLNADAYNGGIGGKYFMDKNLAIRGGIRFSSINRKIPANPDTTEKGVDGKSSDLTFGIFGGVEWHMTTSKVSPYIGAGIELIKSSSEDMSPVKWSKYYTGLVTQSETKIDYGMAYGIFAIAGIEFFIAKTVSLAAEYQMKYYHQPSTENTYSEVLVQGTDSRYPIVEKTKGTSTSTFQIATAGFVTLAIYFY